MAHHRCNPNVLDALAMGLGLAFLVGCSQSQRPASATETHAGGRPIAKYEGPALGTKQCAERRSWAYLLDNNDDDGRVVAERIDVPHTTVEVGVGSALVADAYYSVNGSLFALGSLYENTATGSTGDRVLVPLADFMPEPAFAKPEKLNDLVECNEENIRRLRLASLAIASNLHLDADHAAMLRLGAVSPPSAFVTFEGESDVFLWAAPGDYVVVAVGDGLESFTIGNPEPNLCDGNTDPGPVPVRSLVRRHSIRPSDSPQVLPRLLVRGQGCMGLSVFPMRLLSR
jgi:hypothetical protein